jgi:hypothetical protein
MEKVSIGIPAADGFPQLLQRPDCGGMFCNVEVHQPTRAMLDRHKRIEKSERCRDSDKEVTCHNPPRVIAKKGRPALIATWPTWRPLGHVLADRARRNPDRELEQELIGDAFHHAGAPIAPLRQQGQAHPRCGIDTSRLHAPLLDEPELAT